MDIALQIHVEASEAGTPVWWAESPDLPGFTASADSLAELRTVVDEVLAEFGSELASDAGHPGEPIRIDSEQLAPVEADISVAPVRRIEMDGQAGEERLSPVQVLIPA
jgi:predicted RNase H-like HicB family nuclease